MRGFLREISGYHRFVRFAKQFWALAAWPAGAFLIRKT
jgi:hypothetical protein